MYFLRLVCHTAEQRPQPASKTQAGTSNFSFPWENVFGSSQSRSIRGETFVPLQPTFIQKAKWQRSVRTRICLSNGEPSRCGKRDKRWKSVERDEAARGRFAGNLGSTLQNQAHRYFVFLVELESDLKLCFSLNGKLILLNCPKRSILKLQILC